MKLENVDVAKIRPNPFQPRESFPKDGLMELAQSLKSRGEIHPVIIRKFRNKYQIICGERRWRAAKLAGLKKIPALVRDTAEEDVLLESLIENLHRLDLTSVERENAVCELWKTGRWKTKVALADELGKSNEWVKENVNAALIRKEEKIPPTIKTRTITDTAPLEKKERKQIIQRVEKEELPAQKVREVSRVIKEAPKPIKKAVLKPKTRVTPRVAESLKKLPNQKQPEAIKQIQNLRLEEDEAIAHIELMKAEVPPLSPEKLAQIQEKYEQLKKDLASKLSKPEIKKRGKLFRSWLAHTSISGVLNSLRCPVCGASSENFGWICHKIDARKALEIAQEKYQKSIKKK